MRKKVGLVLALSLALPSISTAGWHFGEFKDLNVNVEYHDYAYTLPNGEPVYYIGGIIRYVVNLQNMGNRTFNNFEVESALIWAEPANCTRSWLDNQTVTYQTETPLPGHPYSGWQNVSLRKTGAHSYEARYPIPYEICPGRGYLRLTGRHQNASGREEVASFVIPLGVGLKRQ